MSQFWSLPTMASIVVITALSLAVGCGVLGNPNPCDRTVEMRNALETVTGRDCDLISDDDLAQVRSLPEIHRDPGRRGSIRLQPLKRSDFAGLENLRSLAGATLGNSEWPSVLETLHDLKDLHLTLLGPADAFLFPSNAFLGLDSLEIMTINEQTNGYLLFAPNVFNGLDNLRVLDMGVRTFSFNNCGDTVDSSCAGSLCTQSRMQSDWLTLEMLEDLPMLDTLIVCTDRVAEISPDVMNTLIERRAKPFAN